MKLALGTVQFGMNYGIANVKGQVALNQAKAIMDLGFNCGMDMLDTAIAYGNSEEVLGEVGIQEWKVVSKMPLVPEYCGNISEWVVSSIRESLKRLKVKNLYGLLLHQPQQLFEKQGHEIYDALVLLKSEGLVNNIGISIYDPSELDKLCSQFRFDIVQGPFNILDRRLIDSGWLYKLSELGIELHVRSVFLQGLLLMNSDSRPSKFDPWLPILKQLDDWISQSGLTRLQACLQYVLSFSEIDKVIVGVESIEQLDEILSAAKTRKLQVPNFLKIDDLNLLNPARWPAITN